MHKIKGFIILSVFFVGHAVYADTFTPSQYCSKPFKPLKFNSEHDVQMYKNDVERYRQCILDFVDEQERAIENHQRAAEQAIDEWNRFVQLELG